MVTWRRRILVIGAFVIVCAAAAWLLFEGEPARQADTRGAEVQTLTIDSEAVGAALATTIVLPPNSEDGPPRPLLVFLHGRGDDERSYLSYEEMFDGLAALGPTAPIIAFPDGGDGSYWHDREDGDWGRYVLGEVIPQVIDATGADAERIAVGGISMGGYGAFHLAAESPGRFCAVGGHSPALWEEASQTAPGAFDDAEDFAANDVIATARREPEAYLAQPVWIDAGEEDPFLEGDAAFTEALNEADADLTARKWPGGHDLAYWDAHWGEYLRFYAAALAGCRK